MAFYDNFPRYYQIEANNLKGLQPGFVVSQIPVKAGSTFLQEKFNKLGSSSTSATKMIANGHIVMISAEGIVDPAVEEVAVDTSTGKGSVVAPSPLYIVYNDPLNTILNKANFYATDLDQEHLRCVQLIPGDEWMSDMELDLTATSALYGRIVEITEAGTAAIYGSDDWFAMSELADGTSAHHYMFIK